MSNFVLMKRYIFFLITLLTSMCSFADTQIQMEEYGGVYRIPCSVNGAKMKFIFDTGASNVCLSLSMAEYLYDNDYITSDDILGKGSSSVADGRIVDHVIINIRDIEISGNHIKNVQAVVIDGQNAPLLMGQSAIQKIGPITLNGNILTIHNESEDEGLTQEQIDQMFEDAYNFYQRKSYNSARDLYKTLYDYHQLSDVGIMKLADCCSYCDDDASAIFYMNKVRDIDALIRDNWDYYNRRGMLYYFSGDNDHAISDFERAELVGLYDYKKSYIYRLWGSALLSQKRYSQAGEKLATAFNYKADELGVSSDFLMRDCLHQLNKKEKSIKDDSSDTILFTVLRCSYLQGKKSEFDFKDVTIRLAYQGNKAAQQYCDDFGINYNYLYHLNPYNP